MMLAARARQGRGDGVGGIAGSTWGPELAGALGTCPACLCNAGSADSCCPSIRFSSRSPRLAALGRSRAGGAARWRGGNGARRLVAAGMETAKPPPASLQPSAPPGSGVGLWGPGGPGHSRRGSSRECVREGGEGGKQPGREEKAARHQAHRIWMQEGSMQQHQVLFGCGGVGCFMLGLWVRTGCPPLSTVPAFLEQAISRQANPR